MSFLQASLNRNYSLMLHNKNSIKFIVTYVTTSQLVDYKPCFLDATATS